MADPPHEQDDGVGEAVARLHRRLHAASDSGWEKLFVNVPRTHPPLANSPALSLPPRALLHAGSVTHHICRSVRCRGSSARVNRRALTACAGSGSRGQAGHGDAAQRHAHRTSGTALPNLACSMVDTPPPPPPSAAGRRESAIEALWE